MDGDRERDRSFEVASPRRESFLHVGDDESYISSRERYRVVSMTERERRPSLVNVIERGRRSQ